MATYTTNQFKGGLKVLLDGDPYSIIENEFVKPGKGQAFSRVKLRNLKNGRMLDRTFKSGESVEAADVTESDMQYLYSDGSEFHFMKTDGSFEQVAVYKDVVGSVVNWLKEEMEYSVTLWNDQAILVEPPIFVELQVAETDPGMRGDTVTGATKAATLSTGAVVKVPLFVEQGDMLKIDTRKGEYVSRA